MIKTMTTENKIYVNGKLQSWILDHLENSNLRDDLKAAFLHKHDQLEKEVQRLINPPVRKPRKPQAPPEQVAPTANKATFAPDETYVNSMPKTGRNRP